ncbi:MAG: MFS transporter [Oscillospiraceae bacterium]|nr:MFS transporter [Oscillospiraceae bacterium]
MAKEKKGIGALNWTLLLVIGFTAQIAWVIENNWFANFLYSDFGAQLGVVTAMTICSATATTFSALFFGTLSDRIGSRKKLIVWGSVLWGVFTIAFGLTHYLRGAIYNDVMLIGVTIVAADTIMSFFGSMANDAGYNAWYADMMDDTNSGQIGTVAATLPVIGTLVGTLVGGMFVGGFATAENPQLGYIVFFSVVGVLNILIGVASAFLLKDAPTLRPVKEGSFRKQFASTFNIRRFLENRELALVFLTLCVFFIGYNCYFIHILNWMNYTLGFTDPSLILGIPLVLAMLLSLPFIRVINNKKVPKVAAFSVILSIAACLFIFFVVGAMTDSFDRENALNIAANWPCYIGIIMAGMGYVVFMQSMTVWMKRLYPEEHRGQFEGIRIMFFVFFPMVAGPLLADPICRRFGEKVYQVVENGNLIFVTADRASALGYDVTQIAEGYLPVNELFIAAAIVSALALIPMSRAARLYKQRNG